VKYFFIVWGALRRRPARTFLTVLSVTTAFFLFGVLQGINVGLDTILKRLNVAHLEVVSRIGMTETMPLSQVARIAQVPGVAHVTPLWAVVGSYQRPSNTMIALAVDMDAMTRIYTEMKMPPEQLAKMLRTRSGAIVGKALAQKHGWKIGDRIPIHSYNTFHTDGSADWVFDIVGFYDLDLSDWATRMWVNYDYVNEGRTGSKDKDKAMQILVGVQDANRSAQVSQAIDDAFASTPNQTATQNEKDFVSGLLRQVGDISFLVNGIVAAVLFTLLFLTSNTMAQSVRERIPELAVLKTMGFSDAGVQWLVLAEALLLSVLSAALGLAFASMALPVIAQTLESQGIGPMHVPALVLSAGIGAAVLLAIVSGVLPARRARRLEIAAALAGR